MSARVALGLALWIGAAAAAGGPVVAERAEVGFVDALARGPSVEERLAEIRRRIQEAVVYPPLARTRGLTGVASVEFEIERDGRPATVRIARSSGHWLLDRAARRGVVEARPLPWVYGRLEVPVRFELHGR